MLTSSSFDTIPAMTAPLDVEGWPFSERCQHFIAGQIDKLISTMDNDKKRCPRSPDERGKRILAHDEQNLR